MDFLGVQDNRLWVWLVLRSIAREKTDLTNGLKKESQTLMHNGIWSVAPDGKAVRFHYYLPKDSMNGFNREWLRSDCLGWTDKKKSFSCEMAFVVIVFLSDGSQLFCRKI